MIRAQAHIVSCRRSPPAIPFDPRKGDLILSNSSSYIDLLYLTFRCVVSFFNVAAQLTMPPHRYNATVLLPVSSSNKVVGYRRASLLSAILAAGQPPQKSGKAESLDEAIKKAAGPVVVFPEATTSNNRAMLKLAEIAPATAGKSSAVRTFVLTFRYVSYTVRLVSVADATRIHRYPPPTRLAPSLTYPIPTLSPITGLLSHVYTLTSRLSPYTLTIRRLHPSESPKLSCAPKKEEWDALAETLAGTARLKRVGGLGWVEKGAFLEFRRVKGR